MKAVVIYTGENILQLNEAGWCHIMASKNLVNIDWGNCVLPNNTESLFEPMLTSIELCHRHNFLMIICLNTMHAYSKKRIENIVCKKAFIMSRDQWFNCLAGHWPIGSTSGNRPSGSPITVINRTQSFVNRTHSRVDEKVLVGVHNIFILADVFRAWINFPDKVKYVSRSVFLPLDTDWIINTPIDIGV